MSAPWWYPDNEEDPLPEGVYVEDLTSQRRYCQADPKRALKAGLRPVSRIPCKLKASVRVTWTLKNEALLLCYHHGHAKLDQLRTWERRRREAAMAAGLPYDQVVALPFVQVVQPQLPSSPTSKALPSPLSAPPLPAPVEQPKLGVAASLPPPAPSEPAAEASPTSAIVPATAEPAMPAGPEPAMPATQEDVRATLSPLEERAMPIPPEKNAAFTYLARLASGSRRTMREALDEIAQWLWGMHADASRAPWHTLRYAHTSAVRAHLAEKNAPRTANKKLAALRSVLKEAWKLGLLPTEEYHRAVEFDGVKVGHLPVGRALTRDQVAALYATCAADATVWGRRDAALLALLQGAALRRAEACTMALADYDPQTGQVFVRRGKGGKQRVIWLPQEGCNAIGEWFTARGREPGFLLAAITPQGRPRPGRAMSTETVYARLQVLADRANVPRFSPHDLRRTYATDAIQHGVDLVIVKRLMGHENIETTVRYDRRGEAALREAAVKRYLPFHPTATASPSIEPPHAEAAAAPPVEKATTSPELVEEVAPSRTSTTPKRTKPRQVVQKKAPRIAPAARSRARTTRRPRTAKKARSHESRRKPASALRLRGRAKRKAQRRA